MTDQNNNPDLLLDISEAQMTIHAIWQMSVTRQPFKLPHGMTADEFKNTLYCCYREITGATPAEALLRVQVFIAAYRAANPIKPLTGDEDTERMIPLSLE